VGLLNYPNDDYPNDAGNDSGQHRTFTLIAFFYMSQSYRR